MKKTLIRNLVLAAILSLSLNSMLASPIDLSKGYGDFKWGMSPDLLFAQAQKLYGAENVTKANADKEGYPQVIIVVTKDGVTTSFEFFQGSFYSLRRTFAPSLLGGYYTAEDIKTLDAQAEALYPKTKDVAVQISTRISGSIGDRITGVKVSVASVNSSIYKEKIDELRSKSPSLKTQLIDALSKP